MVHCKFCAEDVEPVIKNNRYYCPNCNKYVKVEKDEREEPQVSEIPSEEPEEREPKHYKKKEPLVEQEGPTKIITNPKTIKYDAADLHMGQILINLGYAKDLNELSRKNMKLAFSLMNMGAVGKDFNTMENKEPDPERTMKEIQQQEMMKAYIESMKSGSQTDPMSMMMMMRMMDNQGKGRESSDNGFMDKMMQLQMMKMMGGGQNNELVSLQRELADMKHQASLYQMTMQQQQTQKSQQTSNEYLMKMEKLRADRDTELKNIDIQRQEQEKENMKLFFDSRLQQIQSDMQKAVAEAKTKGEKADLSNFAGQIKAIKEASVLIGDKDKTTSENLVEGFTDVAKIAAPVLAKALEQKQQQRYPMQQFPQETEPVNPGNPGPQQYPQDPTPVNPQNPEPVTESRRPVDTENPDDMTTSEREWSDTMSDMYIHRKKK